VSAPGPLASASEPSSAPVGSAPDVPEPLPPLPSDLPAVEHAARLPLGYRAAASVAGIKPSGRPDLAVVVVDGGPASVAATFTTNRMPSAPVLLNRAHLAASHPAGGATSGWVSAMLCTSGCANAATGAAGLADQRAVADVLADAAGTRPELTLAMATGLIGTRLPVERVAGALRDVVPGALRADDEAWLAVAEAMRTTDTRAKVASVRLELPDAEGRPVPVTVSGVAKGVGMIHPNMATMLCFLLTDAAADPETLRAILRPVVARTWDQLSVDGDQSTSDTVLLVASGAAGAAPVGPPTAVGAALARAVEAVARSLARQQARDGEGATTLLACQVSGGRDDAEARAAARAVVSSSLVKAAVHGADPNWGRVAGALGNAQLPPAAVLMAGGMPEPDALARAGAAVPIDPDRVRIDICGTPVFAGLPLPFDAAAVSAGMRAEEVLVRVDLGAGEGTGEAFGCDLTEEYVIENSEYST
jgi:glutamate N-acetyltransferase / amino-acid N-acetyltransferase